MKIEYSARSHVGLTRENNEDNLFVNGATLPPDIGKRLFSVDGVAEPPIVLALCDGMGGREDGELASRIAVGTVSRFAEKICGAKAEQVFDAVQTCVKEADTAIRAAGGKQRRSGTTFSMAVIQKRAVRCFNLGDSRVYVLCGKDFRQITRDHTWIAEHMGTNGIQPQYKGNLYKLTGCLGLGHPRDAAAYPPIAGAYRLLLCSDGLSDMLYPNEIERILRDNRNTVDAADALLSTALDKGGYDNVTLIVADGGNGFPWLFAGWNAKGR